MLMRILHVHCYYSQRGGEDTIFETEEAWVASNFVGMRFTERNEQSTKGAIQFLLSIFNLRQQKRLNKVLDDFQPNVVHLHNLHFGLGPSIINTIAKKNIPMVMTLHNYRLICPSATLVIKGVIDDISIRQSFPWTAILNKAYRDSYFFTFYLAFVNYIHNLNGTWNKLSKVIVLTEFAKELFTKSKVRIDADKFVVKPNFLVDEASRFAAYERGAHFLYVGRLTAEKGIIPLLDAFSSMQDCNIRIAGEGPLLYQVKAYEKRCPNIQYIGRLNKDTLYKEISQCKALIFPSLWFEGLPTVIIEAFMMSTPVISSDLGAMRTMVRNGVNGFLYDVSDVRHLIEGVIHFNDLSQKAVDKLRFSARKTYEEIYSLERVEVTMNLIYNELVGIKTQDNVRNYD